MRRERQVAEDKRETPPLIRWVFVDYLELTVGVGLAFIFHALHEVELGHVTAVITALLVVQKFTLRFSIEQAQERIIATTEPLRRLEEIIDLQSQETISTLDALTRSYFAIPEPELARIKEGMLHDVLDRMRQLSLRKTSEALSTGEYYEWLLPMLREVKRGEKVIAVSLMFDAEWDDSDVERKFLDENVAAAKRGAIVDRVFVIPEANIEAVLNNAGVALHRTDRGPGLGGSYITREYLERHDAELLRKLGDGFIQIGDRVALVDQFGPEGEVRGYVTINPIELASLASVHQRLRNLTRELSDPPRVPRLLPRRNEA